MTEDSLQSWRKRLRAQGFNYSQHGSYFVTICVDRMELRFGCVESGAVVLNDAGVMIRELWMGIPGRFVASVLDAFVIMPNHLHGIVFIENESMEHNQSLSRIIQAFKSESTVEYGRGVKAGQFPRYQRALWQRGFHDKILRDDRMPDAARVYIESNPGRWEQDRNE